MSDTIAEFQDALEKSSLCQNSHATFCSAPTFLSNEFNSGHYNTRSIDRTFLTLGNLMIWVTAICLPLVAKRLHNMSEYFKIWRSILKIAIKCTTLCFINFRPPLELLSGVFPYGDWQRFILGENVDSFLLLHTEGNPPCHVEAPFSFITATSCSPHSPTSQAAASLLVDFCGCLFSMCAALS